MEDSPKDMWSKWLLERRDGGDPEKFQRTMEKLRPVRDQVLKNAQPASGETLLDVGCGDGLIAFGALEKYDLEKVIFSDISSELLSHVKSLVEEMGLAQRAQFLKAAAEDLSELADGSVDIVTVRSVLIYVSDKRKALGEFYRVLNTGGRLSLFEPINRFGHPEPPDVFWGHDVTPVVDIAEKIKAFYRSQQPIETDPMFDFDERDLLALIEEAGFQDVRADLTLEIKRHFSDSESDWEMIEKIAPNPKMATLEEAMSQVLTQEEAERFSSYMSKAHNEQSRVIRSARGFFHATKVAS